jgi:hypothetical protein
MSKPVGSLSSGPACEAAKVIVQVIGKDHPSDQRVVLCNAANQVQKPQLEPVDKEFCSSVLNVWDCSGQPKRRLWLEIASTQGSPIRVPLLADVRSTQRQEDEQWNQLVPILPFVPLPGSKISYDYGTPVLARPGFVYIFYEGKLWRELEICIVDGATTFHDVDVAHFRQGKTFRTGARKRTGVALEDIWIPASWNNKPAPVQLCFSEIQLPAIRLQRLEEDSQLRSQRCKSFRNLTCSNKEFKNRYPGKPDGKAMLEAYSSFNVRDYANQTNWSKANVTRFELEGGCFPVSVVAPQRPREPGFEWLFDQPACYLCDLTGQFPVTAKQNANMFIQACNKGTSERNEPVLRTELLELDALTHSLTTSMPAAKTSDTQDEPADPWQARDNAVDALTKARQRQLCGVLLEDPRYRLRHLKSRVETHHDLLRLFALRAAQQANHASALVIQQLVVPHSLQGSTNPLHASLENIGETGKQSINRCTAVLERAMVWQHMTSAQKLLTESLEKDITQQTLADHLSTDGFDYLSAMVVICQTVAAVAAPPSRIDPLAPSGDLVDATNGVSLYSSKATLGQEWLRKLASTPELPLHRMFWPKSEMEQVCKPYEVSTEAAKNKGDGYFRASELAALENTASPAPDPKDTLDASIVENILAGASFKSFMITSIKNVNGALLSIYDTLQGAVNAAFAATEPLSADLDQARSAADAIRAEQARSNDRLERTRARLGARSRPVSMKIHAQGVQQLRSMLPNTFGAAYFMRRAQVTQNYYLFGLEDLPSRQSVPRTFYGEFLDKQGNLLGSTDRARMTGAAVETAEHLVLVIPRNHSTAQLVGNMNRQLAAAQQSAAASIAANSQVTQANTALANAIEQHSARNNALTYRMLNSRPFTIGVLMIEMWNVSVEIQSKEQNIREKGSIRTVGGVASAYIDLIIAMEALTVKLAGSQSALAAARTTIFTLSDETAKKLFGKVVADRITKAITARLIAQSVSGTLFAGLSLYDAWYAWQWNDHAMYGYLLMAGGAMAGVAAGLVSATPVLGLTPLGWLALLLIGAGAGVVILSSNTPLEDWLSNGPFGSSRSGATRHLRDPAEAFYRLIGLLAGVSIDIRSNPLFDASAKLDNQNPTPYDVRTSNTVIRIESRLPGLLGSVGSIGIQAECRMRKNEISYFRFMPVTTQTSILNEIPPIKAQRPFPDFLELYLDTPESTGSALKNAVGYDLAVRAQFVLKTPSETRYFPAPGIKDATRYGPKYAKADFVKTNRPFWADEQTNKAN